MAVRVAVPLWPEALSSSRAMLTDSPGAGIGSTAAVAVGSGAAVGVGVGTTVAVAVGSGAAVGVGVGATVAVAVGSGAAVGVGVADA
jgi:hypothetical protein